MTETALVSHKCPYLLQVVAYFIYGMSSYATQACL